MFVLVGYYVLNTLKVFRIIWGWAELSKSFECLTTILCYNATPSAWDKQSNNINFHYSFLTVQLKNKTKRENKTVGTFFQAWRYKYKKRTQYMLKKLWLKILCIMLTQFYVIIIQKAFRNLFGIDGACSLLVFKLVWVIKDLRR